MAHPRLSLNTATVRKAGLAQALEAATSAGISSVGLWREPVAEVGLKRAARMVADSGLRVSSLCRGGFFTMPPGPERQAALDDNRRAIEETATLTAASAPGSRPALVLVVGGLPAGDRDLAGARSRVSDALHELEPEARAAGVTLAIEPLHPMYAGDRAVVSTLRQALDLAAPFPAESVSVVVDTFHIWWDPQVLKSIARAGATGRIASYQVSDWMLPVASDVLLSREMMGEGCIDFAPLTKAVLGAGYSGDVEVEIFNQAIWDADPVEVAARTAAAFDDHISL